MLFVPLVGFVGFVLFVLFVGALLPDFVQGAFEDFAFGHFAPYVLTKLLFTIEFVEKAIAFSTAAQTHTDAMVAPLFQRRPCG